VAKVLGGLTVATFLEKLKKHEALVVKVQDMVKENVANAAKQEVPRIQ
jgi:hypothetical protein